MQQTMSRRDFFTLLRWKQEPSEPERVRSAKEQALDQYFASPLHSYPLLSEMPWDMLREEADKHGIAVEGRSKNEIVQELFRRVEGLS